MRQISVIDKSWIDHYIKKNKTVNKQHLIMKNGLDETGTVLRKRKHEEMMSLQQE
jgi:hypothetical protein